MNKKELYDEIAKQDKQMSPQERMKNYIQGKEVDCIPYGLLAPDDALANIWGFTKSQADQSLSIRQEIIKRKKLKYGMEGIHCCIGLRGIGIATGSKAYYPQNATEYMIEYFAQDYDVLDKLEEINIYKNEYLSKKLEDTKYLMKMFPDMNISSDIAGPLTTVIAMRPIEQVLRDMRKRPEKLKVLIQYGVDCSIKWVEIFHRETGAVDFSISDPVTTTDIIGEKDFLIFSKPYLQQMIERVTKITKIKPAVHICGHSKKIWTSLMEIGVDNYSLDNCESLEEAKKIMGKKVFLSGNVSPVDIMKNGSIDDVIQAVKKCIEEGSDNPSGFMLMTGCQIPMGTPEENIDAFCYAAQKYGRNAKWGRKIKIV